jgi:hypothetical protein
VKTNHVQHQALSATAGQFCAIVRIFRIWTVVPDVVYLAGNFCFQLQTEKTFAF